MNALQMHIRRLVEQLAGMAGAAGRGAKSTGVTRSMRKSAEDLRVVWWRWRHYYLEAMRLDLELRRRKES